jgi:CBS domain-containing protein
MTIATVCSREVDFAGALETVRAAAQRMLQRNVGTLLVLTKDHRPVGILTDRDIVLRVVAHALDPSQVFVGDVMTEQPQTVGANATVEEGLAAMRSAGVRRLPVVDAGGVLIGVVSVDDILIHLAREANLVGGILEHEGPAVLRKELQTG